jgi:hypothetical protein
MPSLVLGDWQAPCASLANSSEVRRPGALQCAFSSPTVIRRVHRVDSRHRWRVALAQQFSHTEWSEEVAFCGFDACKGVTGSDNQAPEPLSADLSGQNWGFDGEVTYGPPGPPSIRVGSCGCARFDVEHGEVTVPRRGSIVEANAWAPRRHPVPHVAPVDGSEESSDRIVRNAQQETPAGHQLGRWLLGQDSNLQPSG